MTRDEAVEFINSTESVAGFFVVAITPEDVFNSIGGRAFDEFTSRYPKEQADSLSRTADIMCDEYENDIFRASFISAFLEADSLEDGEEPWND